MQKLLNHKLNRRQRETCGKLSTCIFFSQFTVQQPNQRHLLLVASSFLLHSTVNTPIVNEPQADSFGIEQQHFVMFESSFNFHHTDDILDSRNFSLFIVISSNLIDVSIEIEMNPFHFN